MKKGAMRGMGRVYRRPDSAVWWLRYTIAGKEYRESSKSERHGDAIELLKQRQKEAGDGTLVAPADRKVTVADLLDAVITDYQLRGLPSLATAKQHRAALLDVDPRTRKPTKDGIGDLPAHRLTTDRIKRLMALWQERDAAAATINKRLGTLRAAYYAGLASDPPKVSRVPTMPRLDELNAREGFFDKAELFALLGHLPDDGLRDFVEWAYWTGMRKGEVAKLDWLAFDRETWTLTLPARSAKTKKARKLVLAGPLRAIIERRLIARRLDCRLIFHRDGVRVYEFRKAWATACEAAGLTGRLFHDLRRTGVRNLIRAGVDRKVAMKISGHLTEHVFERYNIDTDADLRDAVEKVAAYVEQLPTTPTIVPMTAARA